MKKGWETEPWNDVLEIRSGRNQKQVIDPNGSYPILGSSGKVMGYANDYLCEENTTIIGRKGTIDKPLYIDTKFWNVDTAFGLIAGEKLKSRYLHYFCLSYDFTKHDKGTTLPSLVKKDLVKIPIPIPPLSEQEEIVEVLDTAFAAIDQAKANIEQNIANAKELFQSKFNNLFANRDDSWVKYTLQELLDMGWISSHLDGNHGGDYPRKAEFVESGISYLSAKCLKGGKVDFSKAKFLTPERAAKLRKGIAQDDDVLFAHNATVGPTALLKTDEPKVILGTSLTYYRCNSEHIEPSYLLLYMRSNEFCSQYREVMRQSTRNQVPITKQRTFFHIIPPLDIQNKLIPVLEELNATIEKLINVNQTKLASLDELKKSILQKAFAGKLT